VQLYKRFAPEGDAFWNVSIDYGYISHRWTIGGETATGDCGAVATLNAASYLVSDHFSLTAVQRFYSARYYSLFSNSFAEGSSVQDENGVYVGATNIACLIVVMFYGFFIILVYLSFSFLPFYFFTLLLFYYLCTLD
jgi:hypothetical protein